MKKVLLCPPTHFEIAYQINPWMNPSNNVDKKIVQKEYNELKQTYQELGCEIVEIPQKNGLPDMVFAANYGFPLGNMFIKSNFKFKERKEEAEIAKEHFKKQGFTIKELPLHISFEGQGDLLTNGTDYFLGWGKRTDQEAANYISDILQKEVIDLKMVDPFYYHLDTCFLPIDDETVIINPSSFDEAGREKISDYFTNIIPASPEDNMQLACNGVVVGKTIVMNRGVSQELKEAIAKNGYMVREVATREYLKSGGSVKCLTLEFF